MKKPLSGKIAFITGSARGFGFVLASKLLEAGATVVVTARNEAALASALAALKGRGEVDGLLLDVRESKSVYEAAEKIVRKFGRMDIWVNNAGYSSAAGLMAEFDPREVLDMFLVNDLGAFHGTQAALKHMSPRRSGTIVNLYGFGSKLEPATPTGLYGTTKAWVASFTRSL
ncbi:MAG: SDR family oxidoreductase, partial [Spirochaetia bacterium]|nr:SDR family oxidoreductase [Spirochaetia bacterium]